MWNGASTLHRLSSPAPQEARAARWPELSALVPKELAKVVGQGGSPGQAIDLSPIRLPRLSLFWRPVEGW